MADQVRNLHIAYNGLEQRVQSALRVQLGDTARLRVTRDEVLAFLAAAEPVSTRLINIPSIWEKITLIFSKV